MAKFIELTQIVWESGESAVTHEKTGIQIAKIIGFSPITADEFKTEFGVDANASGIVLLTVEDGGASYFAIGFDDLMERLNG